MTSLDSSDSRATEARSGYEGTDQLALPHYTETHERRSAPVLCLILLGALGARLGLFSIATHYPDRFCSPDSSEYLALAREPSAYWQPNASYFLNGLNRTPGYPLFIATCFSVFGDRIQHVILVQIASATISVLLCYQIAKRFAGWAAASLAAFLLAIDPMSCVFANYVMTETLFTFAILALTLPLIYSIRRNYPLSPALVGLGFGLAALVRPAGLYLPIVLAPAFLFGPSMLRTRVFRGAFFLLGAASVAAVWVAHNCYYSGAATFSVIEGKDMLYCRAAGAVAEERGGTRWTAGVVLAQTLWQAHGVTLSDQEREEIAHYVRHSQWIALDGFFDRAVGTVDDRRPSYRLAAEEKRLAVRTMLHHPFGVILTAAKGAMLLLFAPGTYRTLSLVGFDSTESDAGLAGKAYGAFAITLLLATYAAAAVGLCKVWARKQYLAAYLLMAFVAYFVVVSLGPTATARYRVPLMPYVCCLAACGLAFTRRHSHPSESCEKRDVNPCLQRETELSASIS